MFLFAQESNLIEGIEDKDASWFMAGELRALFDMPVLLMEDVIRFARVCGGGLRAKPGQNVRVGSHRAPSGGPDILVELEKIIERANEGEDPYRVHCDFEVLHPFTDGNGRTGRMIWGWIMSDKVGYDFSLLFLHKFYYQTLSHYRK